MEKYYNLKNKQKKIQRCHTIHNFFPKKIILYLFFENFIYSCNIFWSYLSKLPPSNSSEWRTHTLSCSQFNIYIFVLFWTAPDSSYSFHMNMCIESSTGELANYQRSYCQWEWLSFTSHCLSISLPNTTEFGNPSLIIGTTFTGLLLCS